MPFHSYVWHHKAKRKERKKKKGGKGKTIFPRMIGFSLTKRFITGSDPLRAGGPGPARPGPQASRFFIKKKSFILHLVFPP
jgi:hypothetical protein